MTNRRFKKLIREYEKLDDEKDGRKKEKILGKIMKHRKMDDEFVAVDKENDIIYYVNGHTYYDDEDSPDRISFYYNLFKIAPDNSIDGISDGCYWGHKSIKHMLIEEGVDPRDMINASGNKEIADMGYSGGFDYATIEQFYNQHSKWNIRYHFWKAIRAISYRFWVLFMPVRRNKNGQV